jgi:hypothetical protein
MIHIVPVLLLSAHALCVPGPETPAASRSLVIGEERAPTLEELYRGGQTYDAFYASAKARRALWEENTSKAAVADDLMARARAVARRFYILAIAIDACSDSVNSIPYVAKFAAQVDGVDLRIISREAGQHLLESHRTPDGRPATPTLLILDERFTEVGCWIERPLALQTWYAEQSRILEGAELTEKKMAWYKSDGGREVLREIVEILEAAAAGQTICAAAPA